MEIPSRMQILSKFFGFLSMLHWRLAELLKPGVDFLGKWMGLFLAPASAPIPSVDTNSQKETRKLVVNPQGT